MNINSLKINNGEIKYGYFGVGDKNLIIIPGIYLKSVVNNGNDIENTFSYLKEKYTVYVFDRKTPLNDNQSIEDMADNLITTLEILKIKNADVYATSQGAIIAQYIIIKTKIIDKVLLASSVSKIDNYTELVFSNLINVINKKNIKEIIYEFISNVYSHNTLLKYKDYLLQYNKDLTLDDIHNLLVMSKAMNKTVDNREKLKKVNVKALVVASKQDKIFKINAINELINDLNAESYFYEDYGHAVYDEATSFHDIMKSFFLDN